MSSFFDYHERITAKAKAPAAPKPAAPGGQEPLSVSALTRQIDSAIRGAFPSRVLVRGELSNASLHRASGHFYFTLKDEQACIDCVMWRSDVARLKFQPEDGMELIASGTLRVYAQKGTYQLYASTLTPLGQGALELAFQQLKARLQAEGLMDPERKKPLPAYPMRIALVTGLNTAALQDMLKVLRRYPWIRLGIYDVPVQGDGAAEKIAAALRHLSDTGPRAGIQLILLARGGGSLEDRWAFNEECVARAIAACRLPVVTGIGHEVDCSIADLVADYHAHTPTEAAQVAVGNWRAVKDMIDVAGIRLRRAAEATLARARQDLAIIERHEVFRRPLDRINRLRQRVDDLERGLLHAQTSRIHRLQRHVSMLAERLEQRRPARVVAQMRERLAALSSGLDGAMARRLALARRRLDQCVEALHERHPRHLVRLHRQTLATLEARLTYDLRNEHRRWREKVEAMAAHLRAICPEQVLARGYSITVLRSGGQVVRSVAQIHGGEKLITHLADGQIESIAQDPKQPSLFE